MLYSMDSYDQERKPISASLNRLQSSVIIQHGNTDLGTREGTNQPPKFQTVIKIWQSHAYTKKITDTNLLQSNKLECYLRFTRGSDNIVPKLHLVFVAPSVVKPPYHYLMLY